MFGRRPAGVVPLSAALRSALPFRYCTLGKEGSAVVSWSPLPLVKDTANRGPSTASLGTRFIACSQSGFLLCHESDSVVAL